MDLRSLDLAIQNNIIMFQRPTYKYIDQLNRYHSHYWSDNSCFGKYSNGLILDAIGLQTYFKTEFLRHDVDLEWANYRLDIALNEINKLT